MFCFPLSSSNNLVYPSQNVTVANTISFCVKKSRSFCWAVSLFIHCIRRKSVSFRTMNTTNMHLFRPPDIVCRRTYILPGFLSSSSLRQLISELAERNSTIFGHMDGSKCNLKTQVRNLGYPPTNRGPKTTFLDDFATQRQF